MVQKVRDHFRGESRILAECSRIYVGIRLVDQACNRLDLGAVRRIIRQTVHGDGGRGVGRGIVDRMVHQHICPLLKKRISGFADRVLCRLIVPYPEK